MSAKELVTIGIIILLMLLINILSGFSFFILLLPQIAFAVAYLLQRNGLADYMFVFVLVLLYDLMLNRDPGIGIIAVFLALGVVNAVNIFVPILKTRSFAIARAVWLIFSTSIYWFLLNASIQIEFGGFVLMIILNLLATGILTYLFETILTRRNANEINLN